MHCLKKVNNIISTDTSGKKSDYNTNIDQIEKKILIIIMINMLLLKNLINSENFTPKLKQTNLISLML